MTSPTEALYQLLPKIHRIRDRGQLEALLRVIDEQVGLVRDDINQLYENWFIETCQDWAVPYIGELVGYRTTLPTGELADNLRARHRHRTLIPRREVAQTIHYRRRKGTLALLEAARQHPLKRFLLISSSTVYGRGADIPFREDAVLGVPASPYGATKRAAELMGLTYHQLHQVLIDRCAGRLNNEDIASANILHDFNTGLAVAEMINTDFSQRRIESRGYVTGKRPVGVATEYHHTALIFSHCLLLVITFACSSRPFIKAHKRGL